MLFDCANAECGMKIRCAATLLLAGCTVGGAQPPGAATRFVEPTPSASLMARSLAHYRAQPRLPDQGSSWIAPRAALSPRLLYVSDWNTNDVFIYDYSTGKAAGKLTGLHDPYGQCVDRSGNVWIAEADGFTVVAYPYASKKPLKFLQTTGYPIGCAVNGANGDLAVSNFTGKSEAGTVQIWKGAAGHPTTYKSSTLYYLWPPAYDDKGNLFVEGQATNGTYSVAELAKGGRTLHAVAMPGATIDYAGATLWDGKYLGFTDQNAGDKNTTVIFRASVSNFRVKIVERIHLTDDCLHGYTDVVQPFVVPVPGGSPSTVVGGNVRCKNRFDFWSFPSGRNPKATLPHAPLEPVGQSVTRGS